VLTGLAYLPIASCFLRLFLNVRKAVKRERDQILPLLSSVLLSANKKNNTSYRIEQIKIMVSDKKEANAEALGYDTIILSRGLLTSSTEEELEAVLAHELGHLDARDSLTLMAMVFSSFGTRIVVWLYGIYIIITNIMNMIFSKEGLITAIMGIFPLLVFLPIIILNWIYSWIFKISLQLWSRSCEYKADKFAANLGYKEGLISYLEKVEALAESDNSLLGIIFASHPVPMKRIDRLERE
jgi:Zn-dependent protease with chaperone function